MTSSDFPQPAEHLIVERLWLRDRHLHVDNVVRPLMLSGTARMSTLVLIISLLSGVGAFGFVGIVLGPVVAAIFTALVETYAQLLDEEPETRPESPPEASPAAAAAAGPEATPHPPAPAA